MRQKNPSSEHIFSVRPAAREEFRTALRERLFSAEKTSATGKIPRTRFQHLFFSPRFAWVAAAVIVIAIATTTIVSEPVWSNVRSGVRRFFMISPLGTNDAPEVKQFWSEVSPDMLGARAASAPSYSNSLMQNEMLAQSPIPPGYESVSAYIINTYHLETYPSIKEILSHTPAQIVREAPYYDGRLYILRFPGGYLISYAEYTGTLDDRPSNIRSIR